MSRLGIVVGNPKAQSRTLDVARAVARSASDAVGLSDTAIEIDLADLATDLFDWSSAEVRGATEAIANTALLVVASPTYKASYTGLLKSFLDWFSTTGLAGVTVVPVMVGATSAHALAVEVHLRPVLVEIGGSVPTRGLFVTEDQMPELPSVIDEWLVAAAPLLRSSVLGARNSEHSDTNGW